jgi:hypothetical protein
MSGERCTCQYGFEGLVVDEDAVYAELILRVGERAAEDMFCEEGRDAGARGVLL